MGKIIVVEDNLVYSRYVCNFLEENGYRTVSTSDCTGARKLFSMLEDDDIVLADLRLPDGDGILLLEELRREGKHNPYVIMTDYAEVPTAVRSMKSGAEDYIPKKLLTSQLPAMLQDLQKRQSFHEEPLFIRESEAYQKVFGRLHVLAKADICVMVRGENGTGKKHIAEKIHAQSDRADKPFVTVDCGLLSESLAASALFGHEIGNLPLGVQQMLLCAIQDRRYRPVGGTKDRKANVRIITATNENLEEAISERRFRRDLYFRLSEYTVKVPPLRECPEDILPLAEFFRELYNQEHGRQVKGFDAEAKKRLLAHDWPGNVRELKQAVQSAVLFAQGELVTAEELNLDESGKPSDPDIALKGECMEKKRICQALEKAGHNRKEAARLLGISRSTLYEKMDLYGIQTKR